MDSDNDTATVQYSSGSGAPSHWVGNSLANPAGPFIQVGQWNARHLTLTQEKSAALWEMVRRSRTLFSDLTQGNYAAWLEGLLSEDSVWVELCEGDSIVGLGSFMHLNQILSAEVHVMFFDRQLKDKVDLCKAVLKWMFDEYPLLHRIYAEPPQIYYATIRLCKKMGFIEDGVKRESILIGGKWINQTIFSLLRSDTDATSNSGSDNCICRKCGRWHRCSGNGQGQGRQYGAGAERRVASAQRSDAISADREVRAE